jgi:hypothetical protein
MEIRTSESLGMNVIWLAKTISDLISMKAETKKQLQSPLLYLEEKKEQGTAALGSTIRIGFQALRQ